MYDGKPQNSLFQTRFGDEPCRAAQESHDFNRGRCQSYPPDGPWYELKYIADELPNSLEAEISGGNQLIMNYEQAQELFGIKFRRWLGIFNL